jgi:hypothetical protein
MNCRFETYAGPHFFYFSLPALMSELIDAMLQESHMTGPYLQSLLVKAAKFSSHRLAPDLRIQRSGHFLYGKDYHGARIDFA